MQKVYPLVVALLNYAGQDKCKQYSLTQNLKVSPKLLQVFRELKVHSEGSKPIWNEVLMAAQRKLV